MWRPRLVGKFACERRLRYKAKEGFIVSILQTRYDDRNNNCANEHLILALAFAIFTIVWGLITIGKYYSLHSYVFDLGYVMERLWQPYHSGLSDFYLYIFFSSAFQFIMSPLSFFDNYQLLLLVQVFAIGVSCFPIFGIARKLTNDGLIALLASIGFLTYFPSSGILWFDVHFQAFFIPLFIYGYYFYLNERYIIASTLFILSGTVRFPYAVFPIIFSLFELIDSWLMRIGKFSDRKCIRFNVLTLLTSTILLFGGIYFDLILPQPPLIVHSNLNVANRLPQVILTAMAIFGPLLFLSVVKLKWFSMSLPFLALGIYSTSPYFVFPDVIQYQYTAMIVPTAFIGALEAISFKGNWNRNLNQLTNTFRLRLKRKIYFRFVRILFLKKRQLMTIAVISISVGSVFYQPYSPLNVLSDANYHFGDSVNFNTSNYNTLIALIKLIPKNDPYVIFQNDMPEMLPRPGVGPRSFLFSTFLSANITMGDVLNNTFPFLPFVNSRSNTTFTKIDYLLAYTQSSQYYLKFAPEESTLYQILSLMINSGKYGILAEASGFILVKRDYQGMPKIYSPLTLERHFNPNSPNGATTFHDLSAPHSSSTFVTLVPGNYTVTYYISISNNSNLSIIHGGLGYNLGAEVSQTFNVRGSFFKKVNVQTTVTFNVSVPNEETYTVFIIAGTNFVGNITVYKVQIAQTSF